MPSFEEFEATGVATHVARHGALHERLATILGREPTVRELSLYVDDSEEIPVELEQGYLYGVTEEDLEAVGATELVRRVLSTATGSVNDRRRFQVADAVRRFRQSPFDTGSSRVAVAVLTERIKFASEHVQTHKHDKHAERGMHILIQRRRKILRYMMRKGTRVWLH